jgi:hypothetical protein
MHLRQPGVGGLVERSDGADEFLGLLHGPLREHDGIIRAPMSLGSVGA